MNIRLTHIDGRLPNIALMKMSHWYKMNGDSVYFTRDAQCGLFETEYDKVYGSAVFSFSKKRRDEFITEFPDAVVGGTGSDSKITVEGVVTGGEYEFYDYSIYPDYKWSIGFTSRGCRLNCKFCVVPQKEGRPRSVNSISDIWRPDTERCVVLLDNDFFGQPQEQWQARLGEILDGDFRVCFNQGINIRLIDDESAHWLSKIKYYDDQFTTRRLYTAWDNLKDEHIFFDGVEKLERHGISPKHLMVYMLIGFDPTETMERIMYRFNRMVERGIRPYPMVYNNKDKMLKKFQRWVVRRYYEFVKWEDYLRGEQMDDGELPMLGLMA